MVRAWQSALDRSCLTRVFTSTEASPVAVGHIRERMGIVLIFDRGPICVQQSMICKRHCLLCLSRRSSKCRYRNDLSTRANLFCAVRRFAERAPVAGWSVQNGQPALAGSFTALARGSSVSLPGAERRADRNQREWPAHPRQNDG